MRILILNWRDLAHPRAGGSEVYAQNLARHWAAAGHEVTFFCAAVPGRAEVEDVDGYRLVRRGGRLSVYRQAHSYFESTGEDSFDVILDVVNTRPFMAAKWAAQPRVIALVHQVAREVWRYEAPWPASWLGRYLLEPRWLRTYRDLPVLTVSQSSRASLHQYGLKDVAVVPEGVDPPLPIPLPDKAGPPTAIFVGRLSANKRPLDAIRAHTLVRREIPDAQLWVVGEGPIMSRLEKAAGPGVRFFGRVDAETKQNLMASAHALVATSVREGWGLTVSEAARLGTRCVGYDVAGLRDSIPAAGGVLCDANPEALAAKLVEHLPAWSTEARPDLGDAGVVSWEEVAQAVLSHLIPPSQRTL